MAKAGTPPDAAPDMGLFERLHALMSAYKGHLHEVLRDEAAGLASTELRALGFFARHPGASQSDLVRHAQRDKAQIARIVRLLLDKGLLQAEADPQDKRSQRLRLSAQGQKLQRLLSRRRAEFEARLLADLTPAEVRQLTALLDRLGQRAQRAFSASSSTAR